MSETQRLTAANAKSMPCLNAGLSVSIDIVREQFGEALLQMSRQQAEEVDALRTVMKGKLDEIRQRLDDVAAEKGKIDKGEGEVEERQTKDRV